MKEYKLWIEIEEYDDETDVYRDLAECHQVPPCSVATYSTLIDALQAVKGICLTHGHFHQADEFQSAIDYHTQKKAV